MSITGLTGTTRTTPIESVYAISLDCRPYIVDVALGSDPGATGIATPKLGDTCPALVGG